MNVGLKFWVKRRDGGCVLERRAWRGSVSLQVWQIYICDNILMDSEHSAMKDITVYFLRSDHVKSEQHQTPVQQTNATGLWQMMLMTTDMYYF